jgi:hypothetical protein
MVSKSTRQISEAREAAAESADSVGDSDLQRCHDAEHLSYYEQRLPALPASEYDKPVSPNVGQHLSATVLHES